MTNDNIPTITVTSVTHPALWEALHAIDTSPIAVTHERSTI